MEQRNPGKSAAHDSVGFFATAIVTVVVVVVVVVE
jgi:hypothetical protein